MRRVLYVPTLEQARQFAHWAVAFGRIPGGFIGFTTLTDYQSWMRGN